MAGQLLELPPARPGYLVLKAAGGPLSRVKAVDGAGYSPSHLVPAPSDPLYDVLRGLMHPGLEGEQILAHSPDPQGEAAVLRVKLHQLDRGVLGLALALVGR